jgi:hypothetical protein
MELIKNLQKEKEIEIFVKNYVDGIIEQVLINIDNTNNSFPQVTKFSKILYDENSQSYSFMCPHCNILLQVMKNQINCKIFRHAIYKSNYNQIPPHSTQQTCEELFNSGKVYGCAKPFLFDGKTVTATDKYF